MTRRPERRRSAGNACTVARQAGKAVRGRAIIGAVKLLRRCLAAIVLQGPEDSARDRDERYRRAASQNLTRQGVTLGRSDLSRRDAAAGSRRRSGSGAGSPCPLSLIPGSRRFGRCARVCR
jgi:hypothetical protein